MAQATPPGHGGLKSARWIARILGLAVLLLFLWFLAYAGAKVIPSLAWGDPQGVPLFAVLVAAVSGVLFAWRWELFGGLLALLGAVAIVVLIRLTPLNDLASSREMENALSVPVVAARTLGPAQATTTLAVPLGLLKAGVVLIVGEAVTRSS